MAKPRIDLDEIKAHLRVEHDLDDDLLMLYAESAIEVAEKHIGKQWGENHTPETVKFTKGIKVGCLMFIGHLYANREIITDATIIPRILPMTISSLWDVYREVGIY